MRANRFGMQMPNRIDIYTEYKASYGCNVSVWYMYAMLVAAVTGESSGRGFEPSRCTAGSPLPPLQPLVSAALFGTALFFISTFHIVIIKCNDAVGLVFCTLDDP